MNSRTIKWAGLLSSLLFIFVVGTFFFSGCSQDPTLVSPSTTQPGLEVSRWISEEILATTAVQNRHTDRLLELEGVVGTATGLTPDGRPAIKILTARPEVAGIPRDLEGVPVIVEVTGEIIAHLGGKDRWPRPVPTGVSVGNINECSAGTIGCGLVIGSGRYLLSNNHVIARQNNAAIGEDIVQPGTYDNKPKCTKKSQDQIGDLADFERIVFASNANNVMDAAIAVSSTANLGCATYTPAYGFPSSTPVEAVLNMPVQKVGRTSGHTTATVTGINVTILVSYSLGIARFIDQIQISGTNASKSGDSGSLWVTNDSNKNPVGLNFAGNRNGSIAFANRIIPVLTRFGATVCSQ